MSARNALPSGGFLAGLQKVGGALMLPIAVLPVAALLLRLGQADLLDFPAMAAAGGALFDHLGLLFAVGVSVGLARENHGAAGLAAVVGYLVATEGAQALIVVPATEVAGLAGHARDLAVTAYQAHELAKLSVPAGILCGLLGGVLYNRYAGIQLPTYLAFFGGRRFVPIACGLAGLVLALGFGLEWQTLERGMDALSRSVLGAGPVGLFAYGVLNRVLIVTGLHHIINNLAWFLVGDYHGVTGDLKRFFAGDPSAGAFMTGFFPVIMFGLPAACLAMYHTAPPGRRRAVGGLLVSMALTAALTGVTEPIEFSFLFLAPALFAVHALLTGLAFPLMDALRVRLGFGFSAGLIDYVLNYNRATRPLLLLPVGLAYAVLYYGVFRFAILRFNLKTPGRDEAETGPAAPGAASAPDPVAAPALAYIAALGGPGNLVSVDACTTRLRLVVVSQEPVQVSVLKRLGARGVVRPSANALQVVVGPTADRLAGEIRSALQTSERPAAVPAATDTAVAGQPGTRTVSSWPAAAPLLAALGGAANVRAVDLAASRLLVTVTDAARIDSRALGALGLRGLARPTADCVHLIIGPAASAARAALRQLLA
jgi:PTS system N-acetylglucosamine-specific IIC component